MIYLIRAPQYEGRPEKKIGDWIAKDWKKRGIQFKEIGDRVKGAVKDGVFYENTDFINNFIRNFQTLQREVRKGDKLFFIEGWNASIPLYKLYFDSLGINVKMYGIFHSAIAVPGEYYSTFNWTASFEKTLLKCFNKVFVATDYMKGLVNSNDVIATGLPLPEDIRTDIPDTKEKIVIFSHRWADDKHPEVFERLAEEFKDEAQFWLLTPKGVEVNSPNIKVYITKNREEYLERLKMGKIIFSSAELETFGYSVIEGVMSGCLPLLVNKTCYPEMYNEEFLYNNDEEMFAKFRKLINGERNYHPMSGLEKYRSSAKAMSDIILNV